MPGGTPPAGVVRIVDNRGKVLGTALHSPASQIALRVLTREPAIIDTAWFMARLNE